jgi:flavorubredoxin
MIAYASVYGCTQNAAEILATELANLGVKDIKMFNVSVTHSSYVVSDAFKYSHIVFASTTYNNGIFVEMENLLHDIVAHNLQNRKIAVIENGSWAPQAGRLMTELLSQLKNNEFIGTGVSIKSAVKSDKKEDLKNLAKAIVESM